MRLSTVIVLLGGALLATSMTEAQPPPGGQRGGSEGPRDADADAFLARLRVFDRNGDGSLSKDEWTDERLVPLFERADANRDGVLSKDELLGVYAREANPTRTGGPGGPGGGRGGPGGPRRMGPPPSQLGRIFSSGLQEMLGLTDAQKTEVAALQAEIDERLAKILTDEQKKTLKEMSARGPGGPRPPGVGGPPPVRP